LLNHHWLRFAASRNCKCYDPPDKGPAKEEVDDEHHPLLLVAGESDDARQEVKADQGNQNEDPKEAAERSSHVSRSVEKHSLAKSYP
jgi:hypothetical protein